MCWRPSCYAPTYEDKKWLVPKPMVMAVANVTPLEASAVQLVVPVALAMMAAARAATTDASTMTASTSSRFAAVAEGADGRTAALGVFTCWVTLGAYVPPSNQNKHEVELGTIITVC